MTYAISMATIASALLFSSSHPAVAVLPAEVVADELPGTAEDGEVSQLETELEEPLPADVEPEQVEEDLLDEVFDSEPDAPEVEPQLFNAPKARSVTQNSQAVKRGLWGDVKNRRIGGADRYETATLISKDAYPTPTSVNTVIVATGTDFPDSLSATPLAAKLGAPLLMTQPKKLTPVTKAEIQRLKPSTIVIIGETGAVSRAVENDLKKLTTSGGKVLRYGGADRYETSVKIAQAGWGDTQSDVFFATGADFPDALSAGAAAGAIQAPVILVPGANTTIGPLTRNFLSLKKVSTVHIVGGAAVVSNGIANHAKSTGSVKTVKRYAGADRFATSAAVANAIFKNPTTTYFANGMEFPDALSGAAVAGAIQSPLLLAQKTCIPTVVYDANDRLLPTDTTMLGGTGALAASVQHGNECMSKPKGASNASFSGMQQLYAKLNKARFDIGRAPFRLADSKVGTPAYSWAAGKKFSRNSSLAKQQTWVTAEAVAKAPVSSSKQVDHVYNMFIRDSKNGTRTALLQTYGGARPYLSVGYISGSTGYATIYIGTTP